MHLFKNWLINCNLLQNIAVQGAKLKFSDELRNALFATDSQTLHLVMLLCVIFQPANILLDENGHVRISDLGLACDFSKKKPHASV